MGSHFGNAESLVRQGDETQEDREALHLYQEALDIFQECDENENVINTLLRIGKSYNSENQHHKAFETFQKAYALAREAGDAFSEGLTLKGLGDSYREPFLLIDALNVYQDAYAA